MGSQDFVVCGRRGDPAVAVTPWSTSSRARAGWSRISKLLMTTEPLARLKF
jgi:hypothetical protein